VPLTWQGWPTLAAVRKHSPASLKQCLMTCAVATAAALQSLASMPSACLSGLSCLFDLQYTCAFCMDRA